MLRLLRCTGTRCKTGAALATVNGKSVSYMPLLARRAGGKVDSGVSDLPRGDPLDP